MSDMQQNFEAQLAANESDVNSRLDNISRKHETELSGSYVDHEVLIYLRDLHIMSVLSGTVLNDVL